MGEFSSTTYAKVVCYVKLKVNFHPQCMLWKSYYDKVMGEFSPTMYTMQVLLC